MDHAWMVLAPSFFASQKSLQREFVSGLSHMLDSIQDENGLGVFILVLANATFDKSLYLPLKNKLKKKYQLLQRFYRDDLKQEDDKQVFRQLMLLGLGNLQVREVRQLGLFRLQFNQLRSFRPPRNSENRLDSLYAAFNPEEFHFNKPFLRKEIFWEGELFGQPVRLLYNKFPFAEHHLVLLVRPDERKPQFLDKEIHHIIWKITEELGRNIEEIGIAYNAFGAGASVNHQHFQIYVPSPGGYPVEAPVWSHNGGDVGYPLQCEVFHDARQAWRMFEQMHEDDIAYNLIYRPGKLYIMKRKMQGHFQLADWVGGVGWSDIAGEIAVFDRQDFEQVSEKMLKSELATLI